MHRQIFTLLLLYIFFTGKAQDSPILNLFTDRDIYVSGETLLLKVFAPTEEESKFVHLDLINSSGKRITGIILEINSNEADGFVYLPDSLSSGSYLLRASTRTARILTYKELFISSRFADISATKTILRPSKIVPVVEKPDRQIQIAGVEKSYKMRSVVQCTLQLPPELLAQLDGDLLISAAENSPLFNSQTFVMESKNVAKHIAEKEGMVLEGIVTDAKTNLPFEKAIVYLSIPDSIPEFNYFITGQNGRFFFQLKKYFGAIPIVLQCFDKEKKRFLKITLYDPEAEQVELPSLEIWPLTSEIQKRSAINIDAVTFQKVYNQQRLTFISSPAPKADAYPFYGIPTNIVFPKLFIELPDFNEISRELLHGVKFRAYNRIPTLQVFSPSLHNYFNEPPLLLLDGIPFSDLNIIKGMGTKDIRKVEICEDERFFGDLVFSGVVAIFHPKTDNSFIAESDELIKRNIEVIQNKYAYNTPSEQPLSEPDFRQVLLWKPSVQPLQTVKFEFMTSDIRSTFKIVIRGKTKDKSIFIKEKIFEVN